MSRVRPGVFETRAVLRRVSALIEARLADVRATGEGDLGQLGRRQVGEDLDRPQELALLREEHLAALEPFCRGGVHDVRRRLGYSPGEGWLLGRPTSFVSQVGSLMFLTSSTARSCGA